MRVGLDIGGTKAHAVAIDVDGVVVEQLRLPTGFGADAVLGTAITAVSQLAGLVGRPARNFRSIGVGIPGAVDSVTGRVTHAVNLGLENLELGRGLNEEFGIPVTVENDVNAAAFGAYHLLGSAPRPGAPSGVDSMAYLNLGTGLAAGLVLGGRLWRGSRGTAGEIGHIPVDPNGPLCPCGQRGCLEMMASGSAVARQWRSNHPLPVLALFEAADAGEAPAIEVRDRLIEHVAAGVRTLVLSVDVEFVVIGGGVSSLGEPLIGGVRAVLDSWAAASPFLASLELSTRVELVPSGFPVGAVGAALVGQIEGAPHSGSTEHVAGSEAK
ncbi:MAG: ROK family protein [Lacisediminihabitans sp.]